MRGGVGRIAVIADIARDRRDREKPEFHPRGRGEQPRSGTPPRAAVPHGYRGSEKRNLTWINARDLKRRGSPTPSTTEGTQDCGWGVKPVLRQKTTIYRFFVTTDGVVQCPRPLPTKI